MQLGHHLRSERGSSLLAVVAIAAVTAVIGVTVGTITVNALSYTAGNRASLQARAAAEAGIHAAVAGVQTTGDCAAKSATYSSGVEPVYNATVQYRVAGGWITGCPTTAATGVRIESTGSADGDEHTIEAIYSWTPSTGSITESGGAVYAYGVNTRIEINDVTLLSDVAGKTADLLIRNGRNDTTCQSGTRIEGSVAIRNGSLEMNACVIVGDLAVTGFAAVNSGSAEVKGNVTAAGSGALFQNKYATQVGTGAKVGGNVFGNAPSQLFGEVKGDVGVAGLLNILSLTQIAPSARITGSVTTAGSIDSWNSPCGGLWILSNLLCGLQRDGVVGGLIKTLNITTPTVASPTVPDWTTYTYNASDWTSAGFSAVPWEGSCMVDNNPVNQVFIKKVMASTVPLVVDTRACAKITFSTSAALQLKLNADVAFIGNAFKLEGATIDSATTANLRAWFIIPGTAALSANICLNASIGIDNSTKVTAKVAAMVYTPGCVDNSSTQWRGQFYTGSVNFHTDSVVKYVPVGLPGLNLDTGTVITTPTVAGGMGTLISMRDLAG